MASIAGYADESTLHWQSSSETRGVDATGTRVFHGSDALNESAAPWSTQCADFLAPRKSGTGAIAIMTAIISTPTHSGAQTPAEQPDKYQWLEDVSGDRSLAWVRAENERTAKVLESDPRFAGLQADALKVLESPDRLPIPVFREGEVYNTWQDAEHVRGIVRRTSLSDYLTAQPHWQTVIDYDALAKAGQRKVGAKGAQLPLPGQRALPGRALGRRRRRHNAARIRPEDRQVRRRRLRASKIQARRLLGRQGHSDRVARLGRRHHDQVGISLRREDLETRRASRRGQRNLPRRRNRSNSPPGRRPCTTPRAIAPSFLIRGPTFFET